MLNNPALPWSYSRLSLYKRCPRAFKFRYVDKLPPPIKKSKALVFGSAVHEGIETYLHSDNSNALVAAFSNARKRMPPELIDYLKVLRAEVASDNADVELRLDVTDEWKLCREGEQAKVWATFIFDVVLYIGPFHAAVVDWKTGRAYPEHRDQAKYYALAVWKLLNEIPLVRFVYVNDWAMEHFYFTAEELAACETSIRDAINFIGMDTMFVKRESSKCAWCDYKESCRHA